METRKFKGFIGFGYTEDEAVDSCNINSVLGDYSNILEIDGLSERRSLLAPWAPRVNTLHIKYLNYVTCIKADNPIIVCNNYNTLVTRSLFETLYRAFSKFISMSDIVLCNKEIYEFFRENGFDFPDMSEYSPVVPEDVYFEDPKIISNIVTNKYTFILYQTGRVSMKRNSEEFFWTCSNQCGFSITDLIYYISFVRGYKDVDTYLKRGEPYWQSSSSH